MAMTARDVNAAARPLGLQIQVLNAATIREIDAAFATFMREQPVWAFPVVPKQERISI